MTFKMEKDIMDAVVAKQYFRNNIEKMREISQQQQYAKNILLQNEGITGISHEDGPHGEKVRVSRSVVSDCL